MTFEDLLELQIERLHEKLQDFPLLDRGISEKENPDDMDTIGSLIDKLITVDLKMWHNQEKLYEIRRMTCEEFVKRYDGLMDELHETIKRCCDLNVQRAALMDEIDQHLADVASGAKQPTVRKQHKTY